MVPLQNKCANVSTGSLWQKALCCP